MKKLFIVILILLDLAGLWSGRGEWPGDYKRIVIDDVTDVISGSPVPCKIEFEHIEAGDRHIVVAYYNTDGYMFMQEQNRTDMEYRRNAETPIDQTVYVFEGSKNAALYRKYILYDRKGEEPRISEAHKFVLDRAERPVYHSKSYKHSFRYINDDGYDEYGNWRTVVRDYEKEPFHRTIYYYDSAPAEILKEVEAKRAYADSVAAVYRAEAPSDEEVRAYNLRNNHNFFYNLLLPILYGLLLPGIVGWSLRYRRKVSNGVIMLIQVLLAIFVWYPIANWFIKIGPYDMFIYKALYWVVMFAAAVKAALLPLRGRCWNCASVDSIVLREWEERETETKTALHEDGRKEVISRKTKVERYQYRRCLECGKEWQEQLF